jgi:hypothetical protein
VDLEDRVSPDGAEDGHKRDVAEGGPTACDSPVTTQLAAVAADGVQGTARRTALNRRSGWRSRWPSSGISAMSFLPCPQRLDAA